MNTLYQLHVKKAKVVIVRLKKPLILLPEKKSSDDIYWKQEIAMFTAGGDLLLF